MTTADDLIKRKDKLASIRANWDSHWQEIADRVLPRQSEFTNQKTQGQKRTEKIFDSTAPMALERFAAAMESMLTPRGSEWHRLRHPRDEVNDIDEVREWMDKATKALFAARYAPDANYASQQHETYMSLGAFGTGVLFLRERPGGVFYKSVHLAENYLAENRDGRIDTNFRVYEMSVRQAVQKWGEDRLPDVVTSKLEKEPDRRFEFLHAVFPREEIKAGRAGPRNMPFASFHVSIEGRHLVDESGFEEFPYLVSRYVTAPRETYGRSPAMMALADIKMINEMSKTVITAAHRAITPALLVADDGVMTNFQNKPDALNYGGVDENGNPRVLAFNSGVQPDLGLDMMNQRRETINDAFLVTLFQILTEQPNQTATEALIRAQEKGALLGPTVGRQQSEAMGPMIEREIGILSRQGRLEPPPQILLEHGAEYEVEYESPLTRAQRSEEGIGIIRTLETIAPLAAAEPEILDNYDMDVIARETAEINGAPPKILRDIQERDQRRQQRAQQAQVAQALAAVPEGARAVKDLADAGATIGNTEAVPAQ